MIDKNQKVLDFLSTSPFLGENLYFNFIDETAPGDNTSLMTEPKAQVIKKYTDGDRLMRMTYEISVVAPMSIYPNNSENLCQMQKVEEFIEWIRLKAKSGIYPDFGENLKIQSIKIPEHIVNASFKGVGDGNAVYSFPFEILYLERN